MSVGTRDIALIASMAALYAALSYLPGVPVIGIEGASIGIISSIVPIFGFLLGPWRGSSAALLGGIVRRILSPNTSFLSWLLLPTTVLSAFVAGCICRRKVGALSGWVVSAAVSGVLLLGWHLTPIGQANWLFPLLHWVGLAIILIYRQWLAFYIQCGRKSEMTISIMLSGFSSTMVAQMYGTLAFIGAAGLFSIGTPIQPQLFLGLIPIIATERLAITAVTTVLGVPVLYALGKL